MKKYFFKSSILSVRGKAYYTIISFYDDPLKTCILKSGQLDVHIEVINKINE